MSEPDIAALTHSDSESPPSERSRAVDWNKPRVAAILAAAARCFARSGFETTTAEIAKERGVPKSIIYHYFDNKTALIQEVQRYAYRGSSPVASCATPPPSPAEQAGIADARSVRSRVYQ